MPFPNHAAVDHTYEDVRLLIVQTCYQFRDSYQGDVSEYLAEAGLYFMRAYLTHDPAKGQFTTWVKCQVWNGLLSQKRSSSRHGTNVSYIDSDVLQSIPYKRRHWSLKAFMQNLSEDAAIIVGLVVLPPKEMADRIHERGGRPQEYRSAIKDLLKNMGWTKDRIVESFQEIQKALR